jgi:CRISPR-associated protein Csh1
MNLTQLVSYIGKSGIEETDNPLESIIKNDIKTPKEDENYYIVNMVFNIDKGFIDFELNSRFSDDSVYKYNYVGNNPAASTQFYMTRGVTSLKYLFGSAFSDLYMMLKKEKLEERELGRLLELLQDKGFIKIIPGKGKGSLNLSLFKFIKDNSISKYELGNKDITLDGKKYNFESLVRLCLGDQNKKDRFVMVVPAVKKDGLIKYICNLNDYIELVKRCNNLEETKNILNLNEKGKVCYICGRQKADVSSDYSKKFSRSCINKIFTTTTVNTSRFDQNYNYDYVYSICGECFRDLLKGEKIVSSKFHTMIAGENVFIIPEAVMGRFDYNYLYDLKNKVDLMFNSSKVDDMLQIIEGAADYNGVQNYSLNFVFYRTDGKSFNVIETIEDVPVLRFDRIIKTFYEDAKEMDSFIDHMNIGDIYRIIPVRQNNKGEQLDIARVLSIYKSIFQSEKISSNVLYTYACEALEKGLNQLRKSEIKNYNNMGLFSYKKYVNFDDLFIKRITMSYLILLKCCQDMNLLNNRIFNSYKGDDNLNEFVSKSDKISSFISGTEEFLDHQGFNSQSKALFYLGTLINKVAMAQVRKGHPTKPILDKIQFQGMKESEICRLYNETVEKLRQYQEVTPFNEALMNRFHNYYGNLEQEWHMSEQANVFYIMAGYSYMIGNKPADVQADLAK